MSETWSCTINSASLVRLSDSRRVLQVSVTIRILSDAQPPEVLGTIPFAINYPARPFRGLSQQQVKQLVTLQGVGPIPPLVQIAADVLSDWQDGEVLRSIPPGWEFGP